MSQLNRMQPYLAEDENMCNSHHYRDRNWGKDI